MHRIDVDAVHTLHYISIECNRIKEATLVEVESVDFVPGSGNIGIAGGVMVC